MTTETTLDRLRAKANRLTQQPGVYLMKNRKQEIIYIGKAKRLKNRVTSYFRHNAGATDKVLAMVAQVEDFDYIVTDTEFEALVLECSLIKQYRPKYNILLKDDKGYHYIQITHEPYPRIREVKQKTDEDATYLGPYTSGYSVSQSVEEVNRIFRLPTCRRVFPQDFRKQRPCLQYHIQNCDGICRGKISEEDYRQTIEEAIQYLKHDHKDIVASLQEQMQKAAAQLQFEKAAKLRDRIQAISRLSSTQKVLLSSGDDQDFLGHAQMESLHIVVVLQFRGGMLHDKATFSFKQDTTKEELLRGFLLQYYHAGQMPRHIHLPMELPEQEMLAQLFGSQVSHAVSLHVPKRGEKKKLTDLAQQNALEELSLRLQKKSREMEALQQLGQLLGMEKPPAYIESYDISNLRDDYLVAGMVVFEQGVPKKSAYKRFSIQTTATQDDYASMKEVLRRRLTRLLDPEEQDEGFKRQPDLILLDGGKGHVSTVLPLLQELELNIPVFGMVKDSRHRTRAIATHGGELALSRMQSAFRLVTQIQDETHRFAISYQRTKHKKATFALSMTAVKGIGEKKALRLVKAFGTKKALKEADVASLQKAAGVSREIAEALHEFLQRM